MSFPAAVLPCDASTLHKSPLATNELSTSRDLLSYVEEILIVPYTQRIIKVKEKTEEIKKEPNGYSEKKSLTHMTLIYLTPSNTSLQIENKKQKIDGMEL